MSPAYCSKTCGVRWKCKQTTLRRSLPRRRIRVRDPDGATVYGSRLKFFFSLLPRLTATSPGDYCTFLPSKCQSYLVVHSALCTAIVFLASLAPTKQDSRSMVNEVHGQVARVASPPTEAPAGDLE